MTTKVDEVPAFPSPSQCLGGRGLGVGGNAEQTTQSQVTSRYKLLLSGTRYRRRGQ